ncbi:MAG: hypothetical protein J2P25_03905 [Nocardiopsaceae bacterium]|nr:hypothetical protein [Nocardiopsaceae bacterium]
MLQQRAWAALAMSLIGTFGMAGMGGDIRRGVYVLAVVVAIAAGALWLAVTAMKRARRIGSSRPRGAIFAAVLGVIEIGIGAMALAGCAMFWPQLTRYSSCESGAGTIASQHACYRQLQHSVNGVIGVLRR